MSVTQDISLKRIHVAQQARDACKQIVDAMNVLLELKEERIVFGSDFADTDFKATDIMHITPGIIGTLFDFVVPSMNTTYLDSGNGGRNKQILLQMRG